jgi:hypothetical protein
VKRISKILIFNYLKGIMKIPWKMRPWKSNSECGILISEVEFGRRNEKLFEKQLPLF